jgi:hypothetical protein
VHEVEQVALVPLPHFMHTSAHWARSFGLYDGYRLAAHWLVDPVTSASGEQDAATMVDAITAIRIENRIGDPLPRIASIHSFGSIQSKDNP